MKVLVDTCIIIDALQSRVPFAEAAQKIFIHSANKHFEVKCRCITVVINCSDDV